MLVLAVIAKTFSEFMRVQKFPLSLTGTAKQTFSESADIDEACRLENSLDAKYVWKGLT
jgi:hypothetical protein